MEVYGRHATDRLGDALAIGVVEVALGNAAAGHAGGQIVGIPGVGASTTAQQVAVGVVAVGRAADVAHGMRARAAGSGIAIAHARLAEEVADRVVGVGFIVSRRGWHGGVGRRAGRGGRVGRRGGAPRSE